MMIFFVIGGKVDNVVSKCDSRYSSSIQGVIPKIDG